MERQRKDSRYERLFVQLKELLAKTNDETARMATVSAVLFHKIEYFFWCGFYRLVDGELIIGPYQGPVACQLLKKNTGVCWEGINQEKIIIVPDVENFPGHIACDSRSKSEIVVPVKNSKGVVTGVLDIDSKELNSFDEVDALWLEKTIDLLK